MLQPSVAIIIINFNGIIDTIECLESLSRISYSNYRIILVDNASNSLGDIEKIQSNSKIIFLRNDINLGFAGGNNIGIKYAQEQNFDYILLLNNDTTVDTNFLDELINSHIADKNRGISGALCLYYDFPDTIWQIGGRYNKVLGRLIMPYADKKRSAPLPSTINLDYVPGACLLIKASNINNIIKFLDERYFNHCEDLDWGLQIKLNRLNVTCVTSSVVYHKVSKSTPSIANVYFRTRNFFLIINKYSKKYILISLTYYLCINILKVIKYLLTADYLRLLAIYYGIKDYLSSKFGNGSVEILIHKSSCKYRLKTAQDYG